MTIKLKKLFLLLITQFKHSMGGRQHMAVAVLFVVAILVTAAIVILDTSPFLLAAAAITRTSTSNATQIQNTGQNSTCSTGWYITGYFNPRETDYSGKLRPVNVTGVGVVKLNRQFMRHVNIEGMGYTRFGWVIAGQHAGNYTKVPFPEDSMNPPGRLRVGYSIATDRSVIPALKYVTIPTLPAPFNEYKYRSVDIGVFASGKPDIKGKHIDVFTGDGLEGQSWAQKVTSRNNTVCIY